MTPDQQPDETPEDQPDPTLTLDKPVRTDTVEVQRERADVDTAGTGRPDEGGTDFKLLYSAISDVGRVRRDNQDSGYAGPWLLTVCDGVGGAARGDIASSSAVAALRNLDVAPAKVSVGAATEVDTLPPNILDRISRAIHDAHEQIGQIVDDDPSLNGTSTTATVALFDGRRVGIGHLGDSRAYLFRDGELSQLTTDHTFVQSLIDEGRITEEEARVHPHRNLILKALDGVHEAEPDLFVLELAPGDRLFLCSDGACGVLEDGRLADILSMGSPDFAAVELVRASLEAGSSDNVTCVVADVVDQDTAAQMPEFADLEPLLVGAAAELKRRQPRGLFRGHRSGDTGELPVVDAEIPEGVGFAVATDPVIDPEAARYAPLAPRRGMWARRLMALAIVVGLVWIGAAVAWWWTQKQYYVGEQDGMVVIYRGVDVDLPGLDLSSVVVDTDLSVDQLEAFDQDRVGDGIPADSLADAQDVVDELGANRMPDSTEEEQAPAPDDGTTEEPTEVPTGPGESNLPGQTQQPESGATTESVG